MQLHKRLNLNHQHIIWKAHTQTASIYVNNQGYKPHWDNYITSNNVSISLIRESTANQKRKQHNF